MTPKRDFPAVPAIIGLAIILLLLMCISASRSATTLRPVTDNNPITIDQTYRNIINEINTLPFVQRAAFSITGQSGIDSTLITFPQPFKDSTFSFFIQVADTINSGLDHLGQSIKPDFYTGAVPRSAQTLLAMADRITIDSTVHFEAIAVGERP
jgi:hypothetical protein